MLASPEEMVNHSKRWTKAVDSFCRIAIFASVWIVIRGLQRLQAVSTGGTKTKTTEHYKLINTEGIGHRTRSNFTCWWMKNHKKINAQ